VGREENFAFDWLENDKSDRKTNFPTDLENFERYPNLQTPSSHFVPSRRRGEKTHFHQPHAYDKRLAFNYADKKPIETTQIHCHHRVGNSIFYNIVKRIFTSSIGKRVVFPWEGDWGQFSSKLFSQFSTRSRALGSTKVTPFDSSSRGEYFEKKLLARC
jgi:hypothetical protein